MNNAGQSVAFAQRREGREGFRARVAPGPCLIKASYTDNQGNRFYGQAQVDASSDLSGIRISLAQIDIPILVQRHSVFDNGSAQANDYPPQLRLISLDPTHPDAYSNVTGEQGNWKASVRNIELGRYRVEMNENGEWYPESMTYGDTDLRAEPLVVAAGGSQPITITLRNDISTLQVKVDPPPDKRTFQATVILAPEQDPSHAIARTFTIDSGPYGGSQAYFSVPPGRYSVIAFEDAAGLEYGSAESMKKFSSGATTVTVQPRQHANITVALTRRAE